MPLSICAAFLLGVAVATDLYEVSKDKVSLSSTDNDDVDFWVHIYAADVKKSLPTVFFVSGFAGNAPVLGYSDMLTRLAKKGYVIVGLNRVGVPAYPKEAREFQEVLTWAKEGKLKAEMTNRSFSASPDLDRVTVMAQSAGNHVVGQALADDCAFAKAFIMIDPVDGFDPFGMVHFEDLIHPGKKVNFSTPALLLDNGLDPVGVQAFKGIPCAPLKLGSPRWYNAWRGPIWHVNATAYGHVDCLDDAFILAGGLVCPSNPKSDKAAYREHLAASADLFMQGLFEHKPANFDLLESKAHFTVDVVLEHDRKGLKDFEPGCTSVPDSHQTLV